MAIDHIRFLPGKGKTRRASLLDNATANPFIDAKNAAFVGKLRRALANPDEFAGMEHALIMTMERARLGSAIIPGAPHTPG